MIKMLKTIDQLSFKQKIRKLDKSHEILHELTINSDQSPMLYLTVDNTTLEILRTNSVLLK